MLLRSFFFGGALVFTGDFVDAGDRVVLRFAWDALGRGPETVMKISVVAMVRDGKILSMDFFWDHADALDTVGLRE